MMPVAFKLGPLYFSSFGLFLTLGLLFSTFVAYRQYKDRIDINFETLFDVIFATAVWAFIGARVVYILGHIDLFGSEWLKYFLFRERPGLSFIGAVLGGGLAFFIALRARRLSIGKTLDAFTFPVIIVLIFGQLGALADGFSFGRATNFFWGISILGAEKRHHPLPLFYLVFLLLWACFFGRIRKRIKQSKWAEGSLFLLFVSIYSLFSFFLNIWRDDLMRIQGFSPDQIFLLLLWAISSLCLYFHSRSLGKDAKGALAFAGKTEQNIKMRLKRKEQKHAVPQEPADKNSVIS